MRTNNSFHLLKQRLSLNQNAMVYRQPKSIMEEIGGPDSLKIEDTYLRDLNLADQSLTDKSYDVKVDYELSFSLWEHDFREIEAGRKISPAEQDQ